MPPEPEPITLDQVVHRAVETCEDGSQALDPVGAATPVRVPNVDPLCFNVPRIGDQGFEELCHLVTEEDPDTALCGADVTGFPWNPPWPRCQACLAVAHGEMN